MTHVSFWLTPRCLAVSVAMVFLLGCTTSQTPPASTTPTRQQESYPGLPRAATHPAPSPRATVAPSAPVADDALLSEGMTFEEVEARWGDTDCIYEIKVANRVGDGWGYGMDPSTGEVVGIEDCRQAKVGLVFEHGLLVAWGETE